MRRACIFLMLLTLLPLCAGCAAADEGAGTQLIALNIGKADCLLLQTQGKAYLIDTGWERTSAAMLELLRRNGVTHLDGSIPFPLRPRPLRRLAGAGSKRYPGGRLVRRGHLL